MGDHYGSDSAEIALRYDKGADVSVPPTGNSSLNGTTIWLIIGGFLLFIFLIGQCSSPEGGTDYTAANMVDANMGTAIAAQAPPPPAPLNAGSIQRGGAHLRLAFSAEGFSGAMIYSQNCYDALGRDFTWQRLDVCGAFDVLAARTIDGADTTALATEEIYFQSESVAGRYLAAATGAGEEAGNADQRLSDLQSRVATQRIPQTAATQSNLDNIIVETTETNVAADGNSASDLISDEYTGELL